MRSCLPDLRWRMIASSAVGVSYALLQILVQPDARTVFGKLAIILLFAAYLLGIVTATWPLTQYRVGIMVGASGATGFACVAIVNMVVAHMDGQISRFWFLCITAPIVWLVISVIGSLDISACVCVRRCRWPQYPRGHCARCGYCLRGLLEARCPECGNPFHPSAIVVEEYEVAKQLGINGENNK